MSRSVKQDNTHAMAREKARAMEWPPPLSPPNVTLATMLDWHKQGCEWPVSGDDIAADRRRRDGYGFRI